MRGLILLFMLGLFASCTSTKMITETPTTVRKAVIYGDKVVVVTETTISREHYNRLVSDDKKLKLE